MNLTIKNVNGGTDANVRAYLEKKLETLSRIVNLNDSDVVVKAELGKTTEHHKTGDIYKAEVIIESNGRTYIATAIAETINAAIDAVKDDLAREIKAGKEKSITTNRKGDADIKNKIKSSEGSDESDED